MKRLNISVALASYNGAAYIQEQINSLVSQSTKPYEIIVSDDRSTDDTREIARTALSKSSIRFQIILNSGPRGFRSNFMNAASHCSGDLIAFCDQDDVWCADKLEKMLPAFDDDDVLLAYHNAFVTDQCLRLVRPLFRSAEELKRVDPDAFEPWIGGYGFTQIFRSELKLADHFWAASIDQDHATNVAHDHWYMLLAKNLGRILYIDECLAHYRQHENNAVGAGTAPSLPIKILAILNKDASWERRALQAAAYRAKLFKDLYRIVEPNRKEGALKAKLKFGRLASRLERKVRIYSDETLAKRAKSLVDSYKSGDYETSRFLSSRAAIITRDLINGVLLARNG